MTQIPEKAHDDGTWQDAQTEAFMNSEKASLIDGVPANGKQPYHKPALMEFGDLRTMTLSPTPTYQQESGLANYTYDSGLDQFTTDQFEERSGRSSSSDGGRSGRSS